MRTKKEILKVILEMKGGNTQGEFQKPIIQNNMAKLKHKLPAQKSAASI